MKTLNLTTLEAADLVDAIDDRVDVMRAGQNKPLDDLFYQKEWNKIERYRYLRERLEELSGDS